MADWLTNAGCPHVAIESTGVYWKPIFNILDGLLTVILVNARHIKAVPGRKTDVRDCEWLADLLRHGLLKASFIPPQEIRALRELTRYRQTVVTEHTAMANRLQKLLERATIKLGQVASDVLGLSGRLMLRALAEGEQDAAKLAQGKLKSKKGEPGYRAGYRVLILARLNSSSLCLPKLRLGRYRLGRGSPCDVDSARHRLLFMERAPKGDGSAYRPVRTWC
jgi:transposase